ncbi:EBP-domain-containing protein [Atractiella rhizophila]|nr:EBP-domain-containing protein [Atractiella rhizophila]
MTVKQDEEELLSMTSVYSTGVIAGILLASYTMMRNAIPPQSTQMDRFTFVWLLFDGLVHFIFEGSFLFNSMFGHTVATADNIFAKMVDEYAKADYRWAHAEPTVVSLEILTVLGAGPLCFYIVYLLSKGDLRRHYWIIVLCTAEIYGGWMTFCPEWLSGSKNLRTDNWLHLWFYLAFMNLVWVFIPLYLMYDSYFALSGFLPAPLVKDSASEVLKKVLPSKETLNVPPEEEVVVVRRAPRKQKASPPSEGTEEGFTGEEEIGVGARVKARRRNAK